MSVQKRSYSSDNDTGQYTNGKAVKRRLVDSVDSLAKTNTQSPTDEVFHYAKLIRTNTIRLLFIYSAYDKTTPIECELVHADPEELPPGIGYEALSYAWGLAECKRSISIHQREWYWEYNGTDHTRKSRTHVQQLGVTDNLWSALTFLRFTNNMRIMWIDAISINQSDVKERNNQVKGMHVIYHNATSVCIWLGLEYDRSNEAMDFIERVQSLQDLETLLDAPCNLLDWHALLSLITRPWFRRRWVIQELAFGRIANVFCGTRCVAWPKMAVAISLLERHMHRIFKSSTPGINPPGMLRAGAAQSLVYASSNLFTKDEKGNILNYNLRLEELMAIFPEFCTSDPRDIIYALVTLGQDTHDSENYIGGFKIDYSESKTFAEVCKDAVNLTIISSKSLDIICRPWTMAFPTLTPSDVPSWVRHRLSLETTSFNSSPYVSCSEEQTQSLVGPVGRPVYRAAGKSEATAPSRYDHTAPLLRLPGLVVSGRVIDSIAELGNCASNGVVPFTWKNMAIEVEIENGNLFPEDHEFDPGFFPESFWRILVADRAPNG